MLIALRAASIVVRSRIEAVGIGIGHAVDSRTEAVSVGRVVGSRAKAAGVGGIGD